MSENFILPEVIENANIILVARNSHAYDDKIWQVTDNNRQFLRKYLFWVDATSSPLDVFKTTDMFSDLWHQKQQFVYNLLIKSSSALVGSIDIHNIDYINLKAEIGYWLAQEFNGQGIMTQAVKLLETAAFNQGLKRLDILVNKSNTPSSNLAKRNNYKYLASNIAFSPTDKIFYDQEIYAKIK